MTLDKQIALVNDIVKRDKDFTIKDYLELVEELDLIEQSHSTEEAKTFTTDYAKRKTVCS